MHIASVVAVCTLFQWLMFAYCFSCCCLYVVSIQTVLTLFRLGCVEAVSVVSVRSLCGGGGDGGGVINVVVKMLL